jgi:membrane protease YdiL (CAAX protease family)
MADDANDDLVELYRARGLPEAQALLFRLEHVGIAARIDNEMLQGIVGDVPVGWMTAPRVLVLRRDFDAANRILEEFPPAARPLTDEADDRTLRCLACGALMGTGNVCPACGWSYTTDSDPAVVSLPADSPSEATAPDAPEPVTPPVVGPPPIAGRAVWWEVAAVVAVGVIPHFLAAITSPGQQTSIPGQTGSAPSYLPYAVHLAGISICIAFVTLYIISRSGEPWARFGLVRPKVWDIPLGFGLLILGNVLWLCCWGLGMFGRTEPRPFSLVQNLPVFGIMVVMNAASAFAEELVTRAYLITRLEVLLRSRGVAVSVAALLFASYHVYQGFVATIPIFVVGIVFGVVYLGIRRVWPLVIGHCLFDIELDLLYLC